LFFSDETGVGKLVDSLALLVQMENPNNISTSPKRLHIYRQLDGHIWSANLNARVCDMLKENQAFSGETLVLEYSEKTDFSLLPQELLRFYASHK